MFGLIRNGIIITGVVLIGASFDLPPFTNTVDTVEAITAGIKVTPECMINVPSSEVCQKMLSHFDSIPTYWSYDLPKRQKR